METDMGATDDNNKCILCGSNMKSYRVKAKMCYKCTNKKCGYSYCEKVSAYDEVLEG